MITSDPETNTANKSLKSATELFANFIGTIKKLNFYSGSHRIYQESLTQLKSIFDDFFTKYGSFRIDVSRDQVTYADEVVHQVESEDPNDMGIALFRDGILWMEFLPGMELWEIDTLIKVINQYATIEDDAEDDIVTALWQFNMPSILYEATDLNLDRDGDIDFSEFKCRPDHYESLGHEKAEKETENTEPQQNKQGPVIPPPSENKILWELTPDEQDALRKMIAEDEKLDGTDYVIEVLLYILEKQIQPDDDLVNLLEILARELKEVLIQGRYGYLISVFVHFQKYMERVKSKKHFSHPHLEAFYLSLSGEKFLGGLRQTLEYIGNARSTEIKDLKRILLMLDESGVFTLCPMLNETNSQKVQRLFLEVIGTRARHNMQLMEELIETSTPSVIIQLIRVLISLNSDKSDQLLHSLMNHPSESVREEVLKKLSDHQAGPIEELPKLLDDPDENIRKMILHQLGQKRNQQAEEMLLEYVKTHGNVKKDPDFFYDLLRTLGRCGSERSLPYLHEQLFIMPSFGILRPSGMRHRNAVLVALRELNTKNAMFLAKRGSRGFFFNFLRPSKLRKRNQ